jgi:hypothetical protein
MKGSCVGFAIGIVLAPAALANGPDMGWVVGRSTFSEVQRVGRAADSLWQTYTEGSGRGCNAAILEVTTLSPLALHVSPFGVTIDRCAALVATSRGSSTLFLFAKDKLVALEWIASDRLSFLGSLQSLYQDQGREAGASVTTAFILSPRVYVAFNERQSKVTFFSTPFWGIRSPSAPADAAAPTRPPAPVPTTEYRSAAAPSITAFGVVFDVASRHGKRVVILKGDGTREFVVTGQERINGSPQGRLADLIQKKVRLTAYDCNDDSGPCLATIDVVDSVELN